MHKITVLYHHPHDTAAFEKYYNETHLPMAKQMAGISKVELTKFVRTPTGEEPEFYRMAELFFISEEQMVETMASPEGQDVINDTHNFATNGMKVLIGQVVAY